MFGVGGVLVYLRVLGLRRHCVGGGRWEGCCGGCCVCCGQVVGEVLSVLCFLSFCVFVY